MTRRLSRKRSIDAVDQQRSVKRLKSQNTETVQNYPADHKKYSTRSIPWEEQKRLGGEFAQAGENCWPVLEILEEGWKGRGKRYLVAWKPHPVTGEEFEPIWRSPLDVGDDLIATWNQARPQNNGQVKQQKEKSTTRVARNRRLLPDSSDNPAENLYLQKDVPHSPPSLLSGSSVSGLEISETQDFTVNESPRVNLPPLPNDKQDYVTIGSSQFSPSTAFFEPPSLDVQFDVASSQKNGTTPDIPASSQPLPAHDPATANSPQTQSPQSKVSESSPRASSVKSKQRSKLSNVVLPSQESEVSGIPSPQSLKLITQLSAAQSPASSSRSLPQSPSSARRSTRLSSPFQDVRSTQQTSSPVAGAPPRRRLSAPRRIINSERLQKRMKSSLESQTTDPTSLGNTFVEVSQQLPGSVVDQSFNNGVRTSDIIMASSGVEPTPLDSAAEPHFSYIQNGAFNDMASDANAITLTVHESIEDEPQSSADNSQLLNSKANSSQESLSNEREVETVDGIMIPVRPLLSSTEIAVSLPAEGKVKSQYDEIIKMQKKAILRFISRTGSPGTSDISSKKTSERNAMQDLLQQLNNTVTHTDLGLPMYTQYSLNSEAHAAYAEYAGSKFELLGYLIDNLKDKDCSLALFAQHGGLLDLLEEYLALKHVPVRRHDRADALPSSNDNSTGLSIDLIPTQSSNVVSIHRKPLFVIAFDVTFAISDPQVKSLQEMWGHDLPIVHLLVTNSSEHVERCVPDTLTSNIRLKIVVRTTYLASRNLGGDITYVPEDTDQPADGRVMDMSEFQRAVRKSPARRLFLIADIIANLAISGDLATNWPLGSMPELKLSELETPPKPSRAASRTPQPRATRNSTPVSRAATPLGKRRLLEVESDLDSKRQRLTPVQDIGPDTGSTSTASDDSSEARKRISVLTTELLSTKEALAVAEQRQSAAEAKADEWQTSHSELMHRFEKERSKSREMRKDNKKLNATITYYRERDESFRNEKIVLKQQLADSKTELLQARKDLTSAGGDVADLEHAREEVRNLTVKVEALEKSLKTTKADFEFTRSQYQDASKLAMDRTTEVRTLEDEVEKLKIAADDNKRSLKAMNYQTSLSMAMNRAEQFRLEVKNREALIKKLQEENATLKSRRGVQTRGSSIQPASSPGPRSRQASPAATHLMPPSGSRASVLRHEGR